MKFLSSQEQSKSFLRSMSRDQHNTDLDYFKLIWKLSLFLFIISAAYLYFIGIHEDSVRLLIRWSAKGSAILFAIAAMASSLHYLLNNRGSSYLLKYRPHLGLSFAVFHTFHLAFLGILQYSIHPVFTLADTTALIGGGLAYVLMYLMAITTFPSIKAKISVALWKTIHLIGIYWIWLIFFRSYFSNVVNKQQYHLLFVLFLLVILLRLFVIAHKKYKLKNAG